MLIKKGLSFLFILYLFLGHAQNKNHINTNFEAIYQFKFSGDSTRTDFYAEEDIVLYIAKHKSITQSLQKKAYDSIFSGLERSGSRNLSTLPRYKIKYQIIKDFSKNRLQYIEKVDGITLGYTENLPLLKWSISKEKKKISGYNCTKATTDFRGRKYIAWFTEEIPFSDGPYKFNGLPGLIIEVGDTKAQFYFILKSFIKKEEKNTEPQSVRMVDRLVFQRTKIETIEGRGNLYNLFKQDGSGIIKRKPIVINPIELN